MNRDLNIYQKDYLNQPYEPIQKKIRKKHILNWLKRNKLETSNIMEVGCGDDSLVNYLDEFNFFQIVEPASEFYKKGMFDIENHKQKERIKINCETLETFEIIKKNFDVIIVSCLLHEIQDHEGFLKSLKNIMNKETMLYIDVPNAYSFHRLLAKELGYINDVFEKSESQIKFQQNDIFSEETLTELFIQNGFKIHEKGTIIFKPFTHAQMQKLIDKKIFTEDFFEGLSRMTKYIPEMGSEIFLIVKNEV